jgi:Na+/H+ antiporter NhaC
LSKLTFKHLFGLIILLLIFLGASHTTFATDTLGEALGSPQNKLPAWVSVIPPLIAIGMALVYREVISALLAGVFSGALLYGYINQGFSGIIQAPFKVFSEYLLSAVNDPDHLSVIIFSLTIGGLVAVISKNGGMLGLVNKIAKYATSAKRGMLATWVMGVLIFFDDYANTLVVGNTMRPLTDRLKISREKLAYLVDSTAAPIASIAFVTTWIGAELGYIKDGLRLIESAGFETDLSPYAVFINSLPYAFYPIFTLVFMLMLIYTGKDFGPMFKAEVNARKGLGFGVNQKQGSVQETESLDGPNEGVTPKARYALIPILTLILGTIAGLLYTGYDANVWSADKNFLVKLSDTMGNADPYTALIWSSFAGLIVSVLYSIAGKKLNLETAVNTTMKGYQSMFTAAVILVLAWALSITTEQLKTAEFLTTVFGDSVHPGFLPLITFVFSALVAFSTGSSWGTMAILYPLVLPLSYHVGVAVDFAEPQIYSILFNVTACVLTGAVLGDHCSPISDTTILSSLATSCNHVDHVKTQMPYALSTGAVAIFVGTIPSGFGFPWYLSFPLGFLVLWFLVKKLGKLV